VSYDRGRRAGRVDWAKVGHVHTVGWGTKREDGGPDGVAIEVHFRGEPEYRVVYLDADDCLAIWDEAMTHGTDTALGLLPDRRKKRLDA
jgi:hypothetical protein